MSMHKAEKPVCSRCGSEDVLAGAWAAWNIEEQQWELQITFDDKHCENCEGECSVNWVPVTGTEEEDDFEDHRSGSDGYGSD